MPTMELDMRLRRSAAFRPQTDGHTERANQAIEHYLRKHCNYEQNHWYEVPPLSGCTYIAIIILLLRLLD